MTVPEATLIVRSAARAETEAMLRYSPGEIVIALSVLATLALDART